MSYQYECGVCGKSVSLDSETAKVFCPYCGAEASACKTEPADALRIKLAALLACYDSYLERSVNLPKGTGLFGGLFRGASDRRVREEVDAGLFNGVRTAVEEIRAAVSEAGEEGRAAAAEAARLLLDESNVSFPDNLMIIACQQHLRPLLPLLTDEGLAAAEREYAARFSKKGGRPPLPVQKQLLDAMRAELKARLN